MPTDPQNLPDPSSIPLVALESMNQTHREEVEMVQHLANLLVNAIEGDLNQAAITAQTQAWVEHTREHFARENRLMEQYGFPAYPVHKGEHDQVLNLLEKLQQNWLQQHSPDPLAEFLCNDWPAWFDNHVKTMDQVTATFLQRVVSDTSEL
jgi:hemerythrin